MTSLKLFGAALVLSIAAAAPVSAQQAIQEPGSFAFYHPNADVLNSGGPLPTGAMAQERSLRSSAIAGTQLSVRPHRAHAATATRY